MAGAFFAHYATFVSPGSFTLVESILVLSLLVFGGMGSVEGSIAGAVILTVAPEVFRFLAEYRMVIYGAILLGLILFRPQGLLGGFSLGLTRRRTPRAARRRRGGAVSEPVLEVRDLSVRFGGIRAVSGVSLAVRRGRDPLDHRPERRRKDHHLQRRHGPLPADRRRGPPPGPPDLRPPAPRARPDGRRPDLPEHPALPRPHGRRERARRAVRTGADRPRGRAPADAGGSAASAARRTRGWRPLLDGVGLRGRGGELARSLPYGDQKRVELARALAVEPSVLLLDEPAAGMSTGEADALMALIRGLRDQGLAILLVEHHIRVVMGVSDRVVVLNHGELIAEGPPAAVRRDPAVIAAYLGEGA